ncbi:hypothetical protein D3C73_1293860 [compost metagenome]
MKTHVFDNIPAQFSVKGRPVLNFNHLVAELFFVPFRIDVIDFPANHVLDDDRFRDFIFGCIESTYRLTIPQYGYLVRNLNDLLQLMRDHNASNSLLPQFSENLEQIFAIILIKSGGRLIQN